MKHIKYRNELINEKIDFKKWRNYLIAIGIGASIGAYMHKDEYKDIMAKKRRYDNMINVINDINSTPTDSQRVYIDSIKSSIIKQTESNNKLTQAQKDKVISELKDIKIVMASQKDINSFKKSEDLTASASYLRYTDIDGTLRKVILVSEDRLRKNSIFLSHELFHLVDDILGNDTQEYSKLIEITKLLDKDIVTKTPEGLKKMDRKMRFFLKQTLSNPKNRVDNDKNNKEYKPKKDKPLTREQLIALKEKVIKSLKDEVYENKDYMTSPAEMYARYSGLKHWLLKNGIIKDINEPITKKIIIDLYSEDLIKLLLNDEIDFYNLIFFLNIDPTEEVQSQEETEVLRKMNTIATNFSDYKNNIGLA